MVDVLDINRIRVGVKVENKRRSFKARFGNCF